MDILERVQKRAMKVTKKFKYVTYEVRIREMGLFSLQKAEGRSYQYEQIPEEDLKKIDPDSSQWPQWCH